MKQVLKKSLLAGAAFLALAASLPTPLPAHAQGKEVNTAFVELSLVSSALNAKHLVAFTDVYHGGMGHQVGAESDLVGFVTCIYQDIL